MTQLNSAKFLSRLTRLKMIEFQLYRYNVSKRGGHREVELILHQAKPWTSSRQIGIEQSEQLPLRLEERRINVNAHLFGWGANSTEFGRVSVGDDSTEYIHISFKVDLTEFNQISVLINSTTKYNSYEQFCPLNKVKLN